LRPINWSYAIRVIDYLEFAWSRSPLPDRFMLFFQSPSQFAVHSRSEIAGEKGDCRQFRNRVQRRAGQGYGITRIVRNLLQLEKFLKMFRITSIILLFFFIGAPLFAERHRLLFLGDAHSLEAFGQTIESELRSAGIDVYAVVDGGAGPYHWLKAYQPFPCSSVGFWEKSATTERRVNSIRTVPKIDDLIAEYRPEFVVIQTGGSLYAALRTQRRSKEENKAEIRSIIRQMSDTINRSGARAYWILPPHSHEVLHSPKLQYELAEIMKSEIISAHGTVFESGKVTHYTNPYPETDGVSYGMEESTEWATKVSWDLVNFIKTVGKHQLEISAKPAKTTIPVAAGIDFDPFNHSLSFP